MTNVAVKNIPYLDGWRGLAIILVLLAHFFPDQFEQLGSLGVLLFFVLSGFLMSRLLFIKKIPLTSFFARRFSRVLPTFLLFIFSMAIYAAYIQPETYSVPFNELMYTLAFLRTYLPSSISIWQENWPIGHIWSLNVEEHSYIYLALGAMLFAKSRYKIYSSVFLIGSIFVILGFMIYYNAHLPDGASPWWVRSECAALGLMASAAYHVVIHHHGDRWLPKSPLLPLMAFGVVCLCFSPLAPVAHRNLCTLVVAPLFAAIAINHANDFPVLVKSALSSSVLRWFGICSYSLYLWQQPLYLHSGFPILRLLIAIGFGAMSFYFFENPIRMFLNQRWATYEQNRFVETSSSVSASTCTKVQ